VSGPAITFRRDSVPRRDPLRIKSCRLANTRERCHISPRSHCSRAVDMMDAQSAGRAMPDQVSRTFAAPVLLFAILGAVAAYGAHGMPARAREASPKGYGITETGLLPKYPGGCSPLTSLYASWTDVDGTDRDEAHSGVDGGRLGWPRIPPG